MKRKFADVFQTLKTNENVKKSLNNEFEAYCRKVIVVGFNSASYDLEFDQMDTNSTIVGKTDFVIRKANEYLGIKTAKLRFFWTFDIFWYLVSFIVNY